MKQKLPKIISKLSRGSEYDFTPRQKSSRGRKRNPVAFVTKARKDLKTKKQRAKSQAIVHKYVCPYEGCGLTLSSSHKTRHNIRKHGYLPGQRKSFNLGLSKKCPHCDTAVLQQNLARHVAIIHPGLGTMVCSQTVKNKQLLQKSQLQLDEDDVPQHIRNLVENTMPFYSLALFCTAHILLKYFTTVNRVMMKAGLKKFLGSMGMDYKEIFYENAQSYLVDYGFINSTPEGFATRHRRSYVIFGLVKSSLLMQASKNLDICVLNHQFKASTFQKQGISSEERNLQRRLRLERQFEQQHQNHKKKSIKRTIRLQARNALNGQDKQKQFRRKARRDLHKFRKIAKNSKQISTQV